jgi:hypothetical protein
VLNEVTTKQSIPSSPLVVILFRLAIPQRATFFSYQSGKFSLQIWISNNSQQQMPVNIEIFFHLF